MTVKWRFLDPYDSSFEYFDINPNSGGTPTLSRNITTTPTVAVGGRVIKYEGAKDPDIIVFSGIIYNEAEIDKHMVWFNKRHQIQLTDDLGRSFYVVITKFSPKRVRFGHNFWRHTYEVTATVVNWV